MHETLIKRTIWVAECMCQSLRSDRNDVDNFRKIYDKNPPRDVQCPHCRNWIAPVEESYIGKDKFNDK